PAGEIVRQCAGELLPLEARVVAQEVIRRGLHAGQVEVVEPGAELCDSPLDLPSRVGRGSGRHAATAKVIRRATSGRSRIAGKEAQARRLSRRRVQAILRAVWPSP